MRFGGLTADVPTPVGTPCAHCSESIDENDRGMMAPAPFHFECFMRMILGSVGHQKGTCSCFGGTDEDPPGMTKREAAKAALKFSINKGEVSHGQRT